MSPTPKRVSPEDILVGGQAVIEGVMMRTPHGYAVAVRRADGSTTMKREAVRRLATLWKPLSWPVIRGFAVLVQSLVLGIRTLNYSFNIAMLDAEPQSKADEKKGKKGEFLPILLSMAAALAVAVFLFILAPLWITVWLKGYFAAVENWLVFNMVDGVIRVTFFLTYILLITTMKDIRRVFQYHGAEHKVVHTWEAQEELTVDNARAKSPLHPRCGTSFLLFVMVVSIAVFSIYKFALPARVFPFGGSTRPHPAALDHQGAFGRSVGSGHLRAEAGFGTRRRQGSAIAGRGLAGPIRDFLSTVTHWNPEIDRGDLL